MRTSIAALLLALGLMSCNRTAPWQADMAERLDSMVAVSEDHQAVIESIEQNRVKEALETMGALQVFFTEHTQEMLDLNIDKEMFTGPLYEMEWCTKYYSRVLGTYTKEIDTQYNTSQLKTLKKDIERGALDSAQAAQYFNEEAFVLHDADKRINKSYGGCFSCLRKHDQLIATLDSLKNYILATDVPNK